MNVFEMYYANGKRAGFWVQRDSWGSTVARVVEIAGRTEGDLTGLGKWPYFNKARDAVYVELYRWHPAGEGGTWERMAVGFDQAPHDPSLAVLSCPGTYAYRMVKAPVGIGQPASS